MTDTRPAPLSASLVTLLLSLVTAAAPVEGQSRQPVRSGNRPADSATLSTRPGPATVPQRLDQLVGTVVDVIGRPMADVEVYLAKTDRSVRTDARGVWRFQEPPVGPHVVVARAIGYVPYVREVIIGSAANDSIALLLRRYPRTLSTVEVTARSNTATANAAVVAERLMQMRVGAGRLYTREYILEQRPYSIAELIQGVPGIVVSRTQGEITATSTRAGVGIMTTAGQACQLQFYLDNTPIENDGVPTINPLDVRSVEVYPQTVLLPGLPMRPDKCGAIVINLMRR